MGQTTSQPTVPLISASVNPAIPPGCPMHKTEPAPPAQCPVAHDKSSASAPPPAATSTSSSSSAPAQCPIKHDELSALNNMPHLAQSRAPGQTLDLPTERTTSSIPRDSSARWDYPSPQQFYNALVRKGWETPEEHVETMVDIHNFLNEEAWNEVVKWEQRANIDTKELQLARFLGRPGETSPKARFWMFAGWLLPTRFNSEAPFDRHDWVVRRPGSGEEVRYVIDYYSAPDMPDGSPVFSLDVRPALDSFGAVSQRIGVATEEAWATFKSSSNEASAH